MQQLCSDCAVWNAKCEHGLSLLLFNAADDVLLYDMTKQTGYLIVEQKESLEVRN